MQKVDIAIASLGAFALIVTGLGIGLYDDGNAEFVVTTSDLQTFSQPVVNVPAGGIAWDLEVPDNGYDAQGTIIIDWSGTTAPAGTFSGNVDVSVTVTGPNGVVEDLDVGSFPYADLSGTIDFNVASWLDVPANFAGTQGDADALTHTWNSPLRVEILIQGPMGAIPGAQDDPAYTAAFDGNWRTYAVTAATPVLENI
jgi:hypothetical protein